MRPKAPEKTQRGGQIADKNLDISRLQTKLGCVLSFLEKVKNSVFCASWTSQVQGFGFPKLMTRKGVCYQSYSEIYGLQEQMGATSFPGSLILPPKRCRFFEIREL